MSYIQHSIGLKKIKSVIVLGESEKEPHIPLDEFEKTVMLNIKNDLDIPQKLVLISLTKKIVRGKKSFKIVFTATWRYK
jgi:hypothetical protein